MKTRGDAQSAISRVLSQARASLKDPSRPVTPAARSLFFAADAEHAANAGGEGFGFAPGRVERSSWVPRQQQAKGDSRTGKVKVRDCKGKREATSTDLRGEREELNCAGSDQQSYAKLDKTASALGWDWGGNKDLEQSTESLDEEMAAALSSRYPSPPQVGRSGDTPGQSSTGGRSCRLNLEHELRSEGPEGKYDDQRDDESGAHRPADVEPAVAAALTLYSVQVEAMDMMQELLPRLSLSGNDGGGGGRASAASASTDGQDLVATCDKVRLLISALFGGPDQRDGGDESVAIRESECVGARYRWIEREGEREREREREREKERESWVDRFTLREKCCRDRSEIVCDIV